MEINRNKTKAKVNKTKSWVFWEDKTDKTLVRLIKKKRIQISKIRNEKGEITTDTSET